MVIILCAIYYRDNISHVALMNNLGKHRLREHWAITVVFCSLHAPQMCHPRPAAQYFQFIFRVDGVVEWLRSYWRRLSHDSAFEENIKHQNEKLVINYRVLLLKIEIKDQVKKIRSNQKQQQNNKPSERNRLDWPCPQEQNWTYSLFT